MNKGLRALGRLKAGTMTKPPPTPSKPLNKPESMPVPAMARAQGKVHNKRPTLGSILQG